MFKSDQQKIYDGLKSIGESVANFYADAVSMIDPRCTMPSKANLIGHMAREIDSALREVFAPVSIANDVKSTVGKDRGHFASILAAVGKNDPENLLAKEWHSIAANFPGAAHREKAHKQSKDSTEIVDLWDKYEKVLLTIVGSFLNITNRLDVILNQDTPQADTLPAVKNILKITRNADYFFKNLDKESWLEPLYDEGFFALDSMPVKLEHETAPAYWHPGWYLKIISDKVQGSNKDLVKKISLDIMYAYVKGEIDLHPYTILDITQIIISLDNFSFGPSEKEFFEAYGNQTQNHSSTLVHEELSNHLTEKLLKLNDQDGLLNLLDFFFGFATYEEEAISIFDGKPGEPYVQRRPYVEKIYLGGLSRRFGKQIIEMVGIDALKVVTAKLTKLHELGAHPITYTGLASIEPSSQSVYSNDWEDYLVYFIRDYAPSLDKAQFDEFIDELMYSKIPILERLAIHFIREHFSLFSDKWWNFVAKADKDLDLYIHEPYLLLRDHSLGFTDEQFEKTITWIETINPHDIYEHHGVTTDVSAGRILRWLTALKASTTKARELLATKQAIYKARYPYEITEHPEFGSYCTSSVGHKIPIAAEKFQKFSVEEQVKFIKEFRPNYEHDFSEEGLGELLRYVVTADPVKYLYKLDQFIPLRVIYAKYLIDGLTKALQTNTTTDFLSPLDFIESKFADNSYDEENEAKAYYKNWLASSVSEFVNCVVAKQEELQLTRNDNDSLIDLLLNLLQRPDLQDDSDQIRNGYINHVLNSTTGRLYIALMSTLRLWSDMAVKAGEEIKWPDRVKQFFSGKLSSSKSTDKEFSMTLGMEFPFLLYIDKKWVTDNLQDIFDDKNSDHFDYRMHTAFSRNYIPSLEMYELFKSGNLFNKALDHFKKGSVVLDTVMIYALLEWRFWKGDPEKDSLLAAIFERKNAGQIKQLVEIAYQQRLEPEKVICLWKYLMPVFDSAGELKDSYSILTSLFELLHTLNTEVFDLITEVVAKMGPGGRDAYSLLIHLYKIANTNNELAGKLVLQVYEKKLVDSSYEDDLLALVTKLYEGGKKGLADDIAIAVSETGSLCLKNIYNKYN